eukprot:754582-Hanusia_phi.AAC.9
MKSPKASQGKAKKIEAEQPLENGKEEKIKVKKRKIEEGEGETVKKQKGNGSKLVVLNDKVQPPASFSLTPNASSFQSEENQAVDGILTVRKFEDLNLCDESKKGIADQGFTYMTEIQAKTIAPLLSGR